MQTIGIFGGTFNPIHYGHLRCALEVATLCKLDEIRMITCANPPHRPMPDTAAEHRLQMLKLACKNQAIFKPDPIEITRTGPSYSLLTIQSLQQKFPDSKLFLIIGMDSVNQLPSWYKWQELLQSVVVIAVNRPGFSTDILPTLANHIMPVNDCQDISTVKYGTILSMEGALLDISSTYIRDCIKNGESPRFLLPDEVLEYIESNGLYC